MQERKLYVPFMSNLFTKYTFDYLNVFKTLDHFHPVICLERTFEEKRMERNLSNLKANLEILNKNGYETVVWIQAFGFGIPLNDREGYAASRFTRITAFDGTVLGDAMCPLDDNFRAYYRNQIKGICRAGAKRIMLDDDYCLSVRPGLGCSCDKHMKLISDKMGRKVTKEELSQKLFIGEKSRLRSEWLKVMGESLIDFARIVRQEADAYDKTIEIGFCAGYTSWDLEGVDALTLTKALAGDNKPFLRLTGAPYWLEQNRFPGQEMPQIIEFTRMQTSWMKNQDVEFFTENDSYPRPRCRIPANIMETFDFFMAVDSGPHQLKYLMDYYSSPKYETGYLYAHNRNKELIDKAAKIMGQMQSNGVYVHEEMRKVEDMTFPEIQRSPYEIMMTAFPHAACLLSSCSIPVTYEKHNGVAAAFGDSGRTIDLESVSGTIIDYEAALALKRRGIDTGILESRPCKVPFLEYFIKEDEYVLLDGAIRPHADKDGEVFFDCALDERAVVISEFDYDGKRVPASYLYENRDGQKFLVYTFVSSAVKYTSALASGYLRQMHIHLASEWMGKKLPVKVTGHPKVYVISKEDDQKIAIAVGNFSLDVVDDAVFEVPFRIKNADFNGITGKTKENKIIIDRMHPWSFGFITAEKA